MAAPPAELPVTYVSMRRRQVFIDFDFREQVYWDLHAHISVSTGVWRIPLVGDPPTEPVMPGDVLREFEELSIRDWDPTEDPVEADIRIMRGRAVPRTVALECAPVAGGSEWLRAGPWEILQCESLVERDAATEARASRAQGDWGTSGYLSVPLCREDFMSVGVGTRFEARDCSRPVGPVRVMTWSCLEEFLTSGG